MKRAALLLGAAALCFGGGFGLAKRRPLVLPRSPSQAPLESTDVSASRLTELLGSDFNDPEMPLPGNLSSQEKLALARNLVRNYAPTPAATSLRWALLTSLAEEDPRSIFSLAREKNLGPDEKTILMDATSLLAESDPQATVHLITALPSDWRQGTAWDALARTMAETDPKGALALTENTGKFATEFMRTALDVWRRDSPGEAMAYTFENLSMWDLHHIHGPRSGHDWLASDPAAYSEWIRNLKMSQAGKEKMLRSNLLENMERWADLPEETRKHLTKIAADLGEDEHILNAQLRALAKTDPESAMKQAKARENPRKRQAAIKAVIERTFVHDPKKALELALEFPNRELRQLAINDYGRRRANSDPRGAWEWAKSLADPADRADGVQSVFGSLLDSDFASAALVLPDSPGLIAENPGITGRLVIKLLYAKTDDPHRPALLEFWRSLPAKTQNRYRDGWDRSMQIPADLKP